MCISHCLFPLLNYIIRKLCYLIHNLLFFFFQKFIVIAYAVVQNVPQHSSQGLQEKEYTRIIIVVVGHTRDACIDFMHHSLV